MTMTSASTNWHAIAVATDVNQNSQTIHQKYTVRDAPSSQGPPITLGGVNVVITSPTPIRATVPQLHKEDKGQKTRDRHLLGQKTRDRHLLGFLC
jgi:hypothetical protein